MTLIVIPSTLEQPENSEVGKVFTCHCFYCAPYLSCECFKVQALELNVFSPNLCCSLPMSCLTLCHWMDCSTPGFLDFSVSRSLLKLMCTESVMPSNHLILCYPLLLLSSVFASIRVFPEESALHIRWPKYWSFSFRISPSNEYSGLSSFRID